MPKKASKDSDRLVYNGKPLARSGRKIYYGNANDAYYIVMTINKTEKVADIDISTDITIDLMKKEDEKKYKKNKSAMREGIFESIDLASIWLAEALGEDNV